MSISQEAKYRSTAIRFTNRFPILRALANCFNRLSSLEALPIITRQLEVC